MQVSHHPSCCHGGLTGLHGRSNPWAQVCLCSCRAYLLCCCPMLHHSCCRCAVGAHPCCLPRLLLSRPPLPPPRRISERAPAPPPRAVRREVVEAGPRMEEEAQRARCTTLPADAMMDSSVLLVPRSVDAPIAAQEGQADSPARSSASQGSSAKRGGASLQISDTCSRTGSPKATTACTKTPSVDRAEVRASYVLPGSGSSTDASSVNSFTDASSFDRAEVFASWSIVSGRDSSTAGASSSVDREKVSTSTQDSHTTMGAVCCSHISDTCRVEMSPRGSLCEGESSREPPAEPDSLWEKRLVGRGRCLPRALR